MIRQYTDSEVEEAIAAMMACTEYAEPVRPAAPASSPGPDVTGDRPGDHFNRQAAWRDILEPHGWKVHHATDKVTFWTRPGKEPGKGLSATTGHCRGEGTGERLYVFSSAAPPFEPNTSYSKFAAAAMLDHGGDFSAAGRALVKQGYGTPPAPSVVTWGSVPGLAVRDGEPAPADGRIFLWMSELRHRPKSDKWILDGYLSRGGVTLLSAIWKAGKSTWLSHLVKAFGDGSAEYCGRAIKQGKVLYVTEEDQETWAERRDELGLRDNAAVICRPFNGRPNAEQWKKLIDGLAAAVTEHGFDLVVMDTLSKLWSCREENDATAVEDALMPLWQIARAGAALLLVHHLRKSDGTQFVGARGSGGLSAFAETLVDLRRYDAANKKDRRRVLTGVGRYRETPDELTVSLREDNSGYVVVGNKSDEDPDDPLVTKGIGEYVLAALPDGPPGDTVEQVNERVTLNRGRGYRKQDVIAELGYLAGAGKVARSGSGLRGDPHRYCRPPVPGE